MKDGTSCQDDSNHICVDGECLKLGCDLKLNSNLERDICGICGGKGEGCNLIEGEFTQPLGKGMERANQRWFIPVLNNAFFFCFICDSVQSNCLNKKQTYSAMLKLNLPYAATNK